MYLPVCIELNRAGGRAASLSRLDGHLQAESEFPQSQPRGDAIRSGLGGEPKIPGMERRGRRRIADALACTVCAILLGCCTAGCEIMIGYEVRGMVKNSVDGQPIGGVKVQLHMQKVGAAAVSPESLTMPIGPAPVSTAPDGSFSLKFEEDEGEWGSDPKWSLIMTKDGFAGEVVDVSLHKEPKSSDEEHLIVVLVYMRPKPSPKADVDNRR